MAKLSRLNLYVLLVAGAGALALAQALLGFHLSSIDPVMLGILLVLAAVSQRVQIVLFRSSAISVSIASVIASYVLFGTETAVLVSVVEALVNSFTPRRKPLVKVAFNAGNLATSAYAAGTVYTLAGGMLRPSDIVGTLVAVAVSAAVYFIVNTFLAAAVIAISERQGIVTIWRTNYSWMPVNFLATAAQGAALAMASQALGVFGVAVFTLPLAVAWYSFKLYMAKSSEVRQRNAELSSVNEMLRRTNDRLEQSHLSVIGALMGALEAKATTDAAAAADTVHYSMRVAERLGCTTEEVAAIKLGALFHDIGTMGIPQELLAKRSSLDEAELEQVRAHTTIGANLLSNIPMLEKIRPIVLSHHERYDGSGYPQGLKEDQIPLAAQIIAVADAYQAMTRARPHRGAFAPKRALRELRANAGTQFNPVVVEAFVSVAVEERRKAARGASQTQPAMQQALEAVRVTI
ncbi:MAG TPA: HD-GYP domain-containing protein [Candidatus Limnocylindria bacterium]